MTIYAKKVDKNQAEIVEFLRKAGASVYVASGMGHGMPDLLIGINGKTILVEIKSTEKAKFTDAQLKFMASWKGDAVVRIDSIESAQRLINVVK